MVLLAVVTACGGDDSDDDPSSTTTAAPDTTAEPTTTLAPEEAAKAAYLEFVDTVERLATTEPDPNDPAITRLAVDPVLGDLRDSLSTMHAENHIVRLGPRTSHRIISAAMSEPGDVVIRDCYVGNDTTVDQDDGSIVDEGLSTRVLEARIRTVDGRWKVSRVDTLEKLDGEVPCPE